MNFETKTIQYDPTLEVQAFESEEEAPMKEFILLDNRAQRCMVLTIMADEDGVIRYTNEMFLNVHRQGSIPTLPEEFYSEIDTEEFYIQLDRFDTVISDFVLGEDG
jgi:hypothetical protein